MKFKYTHYILVCCTTLSFLLNPYTSNGVFASSLSVSESLENVKQFKSVSSFKNLDEYQLEEMKNSFSNKMLMIAAYYYSDINYLLDANSLIEMLNFNKKDVINIIDSLSTSEKKLLFQYVPIVEQAYNEDKNPNTTNQYWDSIQFNLDQAVPDHIVTDDVYQDVYPYQNRQDNVQDSVYLDSQNLSLKSLSDFSLPNAFSFDTKNTPFVYQSDFNSDMNSSYKTATQSKTDLYLKGKNGLDFELTRMYDSLNSKITNPSYEFTEFSQTCKLENSDYDASSPASDCMGNTANSAVNNIQDKDYYIATGWSLNLPVMRDTYIYESIPISFQPNIKYDTYSRNYNADKGIRRFVLESGATYEFNINAGTSEQYPINYPYKNVVYRNQDNSEHILVIDGKLTYGFDDNGRLLYKRNQFGEEITYLYTTNKIVITDTIGRVTQIEVDNKRIKGFQVFTNSGEELYEISYNAAYIEHTTSLRLATQGQIDHYEMTDINAPYYQLNTVTDTLNNRTIETYSYYSPDITTHADFNFEDDYYYMLDDNGKVILDQNRAESTEIFNRDRSTYGEIEYLLLKKVENDKGLATHYQYSLYNKLWSSQPDWLNQIKNRGTIRNYLDSNILTYIGYNPVTSIYYTFEDEKKEKKILQKMVETNEEDAKEIWNVSRNDNQLAYFRLADALHRTGDQLKSKTSYNFGEYVTSTIDHYTPNKYGTMKKVYTSNQFQDIENRLQQTIANKSTDFAKDQVTSIYYEDGINPSLIKLFTDNLAKDSRSNDLKKDLYFGNNLSLIKGSAAIQKNQYDEYGNIAQHTDSSDNTTTSLYKGPYHQISYTETVSADHSQTKKKSFDYNLDGTLSKTTEINAYLIQGEHAADTLVTDYLNYNTNHQPTHIRRSSSGSNFGNYRESNQYIDYDDYGLNMTKQTYYLTTKYGGAAEPFSYLYQYDSYNRLITMTYPDQSKIDSNYDSQDRLTNEKFTPNDGSKTLDYTYVYIDDKRQIKKQGPDGLQTVTTYNPFGSIQSQKAISKGEERTLLENIFNSSGTIIMATRPYGEPNKQTKYEYTVNGEVARSIDPIGNITRFYYGNTVVDGADTLPINSLKIVHPNGKTEVTLETLTGQKAVYQEKSKSKNRETLFEYNSFDQNTKQTVVADEKEQTTNYNYDSDGHLIFMKDSPGTVYTYKYDFNGMITERAINNEIQQESKFNEVGWLLSSVKKQKSDTPELKDTIREKHYVYNKSGLIASYENELKEKHLYKYNGYAQSTLIEVKDEQNHTIYSINKNYDPDNLLIHSIHSSNEASAIEYEYDKWKRLSKQTVGGHSYQLTYDQLDQISHLKYSDGQAVDYTYDSLGRIDTVSYPKMGTVQMRYSIDNDKNTVETRQANGHSQTMTMNAFNEVTANEFKNFNQHSKYDGFSNKIENAINGEKNSFTYDSLNRIKTEQTSDSNINYDYDANGNIQKIGANTFTELDNGSTTLQYDGLNQLHKLNITQENDVEKAITYTYYGDGLRASKTVGTQKTQYIYLNGRVIEELDADGNTKARNIWGTNLLFRELEGDIKSHGYYYYNNHGDVVEIKDQSGQTLNTYKYDIWGNIVSKTGEFDNPYTYAGGQYDEESGYYYLKSRYYDPKSKRFITEDTYEGEVTHPLTLNLYTYVTNNPLLYTDPSGHRSKGIDFSWAGFLYRYGNSIEIANILESRLDGDISVVQMFDSLGMSFTDWDDAIVNDDQLGTISYQKGAEPNKDETMVGTILSWTGQNVTHLAKKTGTDPATGKAYKNPDYKVDGVLTELKTLKGEKLNLTTGAGQLASGLSQARTVILDARKYEHVSEFEAFDMLFYGLVQAQRNNVALYDYMELQVWTRDGMYIWNIGDIGTDMETI